MRKIFKGGAKFALVFILITIVCSNAWDTFVDNKLYHCSDDGPWDYFDPGDWVHTHDGIPIQVVSQIVSPGDMSGPDMLKEGWTENRLWYLWFAFLGVSVIVSAALACVPWRPAALRK